MSTAANSPKKDAVPAIVYPESVEVAAARLKVLSHPKRIAIVDLLARKGALTVTQIFTQLDMPQAIASAHLINMKDRGILASKKSGTSIQYTLRVPALMNVIHCLEDHVVPKA